MNFQLKKLEGTERYMGNFLRIQPSGEAFYAGLPILGNFSSNLYNFERTNIITACKFKKKYQQKFQQSRNCNKKIYIFIFIYVCISNSEYLVKNPVQAALQSHKRLKAKHFFEYFWLGMTLRPKGSRNLF